MSDLDTEILELKTEGKSLREIASVFGISHEAVRKRLKNLEGKGNVSTIESEPKLTASTIQNEKVSTAPNAHQSRASEEVTDTVNRVSTSNAPCPTITEGVNPLETPSDKLPEAGKGVFQGVDPDYGDLLSDLRSYLQARGNEMYRMKSDSYEGYQIEDERSRIRFYVFRKGMRE